MAWDTTITNLLNVWVRPSGFLKAGALCCSVRVSRPSSCLRTLPRRPAAQRTRESTTSRGQRELLSSVHPVYGRLFPLLMSHTCSRRVTVQRGTGPSKYSYIDQMREKHDGFICHGSCPLTREYVFPLSHTPETRGCIPNSRGGSLTRRLSRVERSCRARGGA